MFDLKNFTGLTDQQMAAATSLTTPVLESVSNALRMQTSYLQRMEELTSEALQRRRAAITAAQRLIERLRTTPDPAGMFQAQQEWAAGATQRMLADATSWQAAGVALLGELNTQWLPSLPSVPASPHGGPRRTDKMAA